jgi:phosphoglycerate-specific signal transduction histidine kinase
VLADPLRFEQMLTNLIGNAVKYGAPPVMVRVQPADDPDATTVEVVDAGGGVPPDFAGSCSTSSPVSLGSAPVAPDSACTSCARSPRRRVDR